MRALKGLILLMPVIFVSQSHAASSVEILSCNYNLQQWVEKSHHSAYGLGSLNDITKPLRPDSLEGAMLLEPGTDPNCEVCSGLKDAAILLLDSGVYKISYGDAERAKMTKGTDYISAKIAGTDANDLYVDFQDGPLMQAARAKINFNSTGVAVFWPQVNYNWKELLASKDSSFHSDKYISLHAEPITGTPEAEHALEKISGLVKAGVKEAIAGFSTERDEDNHPSLSDLKSSVKEMSTYSTQQLPKELNEAKQRLSDAQTKLAPIQKDFNDLTQAMNGKSYSNPVKNALNAQLSADASKILELQGVIEDAKKEISGYEDDRVKINARLVEQMYALQTQQKAVDDVLAKFKATGAIDCAEKLP